MYGEPLRPSRHPELESFTLKAVIRSALANKRYLLRRCHFRGLFHAVSNVLFSRASPAIFRQR